MTPERWQQVVQVYTAALDSPPEARGGYLTEACGDDTDLRDEVESLLAQEQADLIVDRPLGESAAAVFDEHAPPMIGTTIGRYEITGELGRGGMGEVYRARDTSPLRRDVALKVLPEAFTHDAERLARFKREAQALGALNHTNIGAIYGFEETGSTTGRRVSALVLELVEGPTLAERIAEGSLQIDEALTIARQIAEGLQAAHEQHIIHRDLKPANIKIRPDGVVKVLDFGLAKPLEPAASGDASVSPTITSPAIASQGIILGTAAYMSPEQAKGKAADRRSDIWALGCVLYEMLTGTRAFPGEDVSDTLAAVLRGEPDWGALPSNTPAPIVALLRRCLEKDRRQRLADVSTVLFVMTEPAILAPAPPPLPTWRAVTTRPALVGGGLLLGVLLTAIVVVVIQRPDDSRSPSTPARSVSRFYVTLPPDTRFSSGLAPGGPGPLVAASPDGSRFVYAGDGALYIRSLSQLDATPLRGTEGSGANNADSPFFSPDGEWVGFWQTNRLKKVPARGGTAVTLCDAPGFLYGVSWDSDNSIFFSLGADIWRVSGSGAMPESVLKVEPGKYAYSPHLLPDQRTLIFSLSTGQGMESQIVAHSLDGGARTVIARGGDAKYLASGYLVYAAERSMMAARFDIHTLKMTGQPVQVLDDVRRIGSGGPAHWSVSDVGMMVYVPRAAQVAPQRQLVWVDRQGNEEPIDLPARAYQYPRLSPDGTRLAVEVREPSTSANIWIVDLGRGASSRLTLDLPFNRIPYWTSDSRRVLFNAAPTGGPTGDLAWQSADGRDGMERLVVGSAGATVPSPTGVSSDGSRIIFTQERDPTDRDIMQLTLEGRRVQPLVQTKFDERNGIVSPDGRWLAYDSNMSRQREVYVCPYPCVDAGRWIISASGGAQPLWSRDGRELFYFSPAGLLMTTRIEAGTAWHASSPTQVLAHRFFRSEAESPRLDFRSYDVSRDGKRFIMVKDLGDAVPQAPLSSRIIVVQNWFEELKRLVP